MYGSSSTRSYERTVNPKGTNVWAISALPQPRSAIIGLGVEALDVERRLN